MDVLNPRLVKAGVVATAIAEDCWALTCTGRPIGALQYQGDPALRYGASRWLWQEKGTRYVEPQRAVMAMLRAHLGRGWRGRPVTPFPADKLLRKE